MDGCRCSAASAATCAKCNNFGGSAYVPNYLDFTASVILGLEQWARHTASASEIGVPGKLKMHLQRIYPGGIVRQVPTVRCCGA